MRVVHSFAKVMFQQSPNHSTAGSCDVACRGLFVSHPQVPQQRLPPGGVVSMRNSKGAAGRRELPVSAKTKNATADTTFLLEYRHTEGWWGGMLACTLSGIALSHQQRSTCCPPRNAS